MNTPVSTRQLRLSINGTSYRLQGFCTHAGDADGGHWYAGVIGTGGRATIINDSQSYEVSLSTTRTYIETSSVLFFQIEANAQASTQAHYRSPRRSTHHLPSTQPPQITTHMPSQPQQQPPSQNIPSTPNMPSQPQQLPPSQPIIT